MKYKKYHTKSKNIIRKFLDLIKATNQLNKQQENIEPNTLISYISVN
jgi:hypothetical protein